MDIKALPALLKLTGANFRMADGAALQEKLGVKPGAVSPLAVMNDTAGDVKLVLDKELMAAAKLGVHPMRNDATVTLTKKKSSNVVLVVIDRGPGCKRSLRLLQAPHTEPSRLSLRFSR